MPISSPKAEVHYPGNLAAVHFFRGDVDRAPSDRLFERPRPRR